MTLARGSIGGYEYDRMVLLFSMMDGAREIPCAVSASAMDDLEHVSRTRAGAARRAVLALARPDRTMRVAQIRGAGVRGQSRRHHPAQHRFSRRADGDDLIGAREFIGAGRHLRISRKFRLASGSPSAAAFSNHWRASREIAANAVALVVDRAQAVHGGGIVERDALFEQAVRLGIVAANALAVHIEQAEIVHADGHAGLEPRSHTVGTASA